MDTTKSSYKSDRGPNTKQKITQFQQPDQEAIDNAIRDQVEKAEDFFLGEDYEQSINVYTELIGAYDCELVIGKFFKPAAESYLIKYLIEVHKRGFSSQKITSLLFNLFIKHKTISEMNGFIKYIENAQKLINQQLYNQMQNSQSNPYSNLHSTTTVQQQHIIQQSQHQQQQQNMQGSYAKAQIFLRNFDVDIAIEILNKNGFVDEAKRISTKSKISDFVIKDLISRQLYLEAATKIFDNHSDPFAVSLLFKYGPTLIKSDESAAQIVCQAASLIYREKENPGKDVNKDFLNLFWNNPKYLEKFLKDICSDNSNRELMTIFISLLIPNQNADDDTFFGNKVVADPSRAIKLMKNKQTVFDENHILTICIEKHFILGFMTMMTRLGRDDEAFQYAFDNSNNIEEFIDWVMDPETQLNTNNWVTLFTNFVQKEQWNKIKNYKLSLPLIKKSISKASELRSLEWIITKLYENDELPMELIQESLLSNLNELEDENTQLKIEKEKREKELKKINRKDDLVSFSKYCCACGKELTFPCTCFMCGHAVHSTCRGSEELQCPFCEDVKESSIKDHNSLVDKAVNIIKSTITRN